MVLVVGRRLLSERVGRVLDVREAVCRDVEWIKVAAELSEVMGCCK